MAQLIKPNGDISSVERIAPKNGDTFELDEMSSYVGGYIEVVRPLDVIGLGLVLVVNEEGLLLDLPYNVSASRLAGHEIRGNAIFCAERGEELVALPNNQEIPT